MTDTERARRQRDVAAEITDQILAHLQSGVLPWRKPWDGARCGAALPRRITGETYRGVNVVLLWCAALEHGYASPYWLTFNQALKLGAHVRKGERGRTVVYYGQATRTMKGDDDSREAFRFLKWYMVFNADQIEGLPERFYPAAAVRPALPIASHEAWFAKLDIERILTRDIACYIPSRDAIGMPPIAAFDTPEDYAATQNHESVHATMAPHRLGRDMSAKFGELGLAAEELVAEIGASFLGCHLDLPPGHIHDHASYISHWMKLLNNDKRAFLVASGQAQLAVDWLLEKSPPPEAGVNAGSAPHVAA